jgi:hypothetical protein
MLDSLAKDNLLKVLERMAPEALVPNFIANLQKVADEVSSAQKGIECKKRQRLRQNENHFPATIRREYIIWNGWDPTLISPRNGLSNAPNK